MNKILNKIIFIFTIMIIVMLLNPIVANASIIVKTKEEAKTNYEKYLSVQKTQPAEAYKYHPVLLTGKEKTLVNAQNAEIKYYEEAQKELFDYKIEGKKLIVKINDKDIYEMLTKSTEVKKGMPLYEKLKKYVNNTDKIGLYIKFYYESDTVASRQYYSVNPINYHYDVSSEWMSSTDAFGLHGGADNKGTYMRMELPTVLINYDKNKETFTRSEEYEAAYWEETEILVFDDVRNGEGNVEITLASGEKVLVPSNTADYVIFEPTVELQEEGDIDGNGKIDTKDARFALLAYVGKEKLTPAQKNVADVNKDGKVDTKDARQMLLKYVGKIKDFDKS